MSEFSNSDRFIRTFPIHNYPTNPIYLDKNLFRPEGGGALEFRRSIQLKICFLFDRTFRL